MRRRLAVVPIAAIAVGTLVLTGCPEHTPRTHCAFAAAAISDGAGADEHFVLESWRSGVADVCSISNTARTHTHRARVNIANDTIEWDW